MLSNLRSLLSDARDKYAPANHVSSFRATGKITPEEFVRAGDYLVNRFPSWSWADAAEPSKRVSFLPAGKQYLVTRGVPCHRRLEEAFAGQAGAGHEDVVVADELSDGHGDGEGEGWLQAGASNFPSATKSSSGDLKKPVAADAAEASNEGDDDIPDIDDDIPDMDEEDDDEAIIKNPKGAASNP